MRVFKLFRKNEEIRTRSNKPNIYHSLGNAKSALRQFIKSENRRDLKKKTEGYSKIDQLKFEDCCIIEYDLVPKDTHKLH